MPNINDCKLIVDEVNNAISKSYESESYEEKRNQFFLANKKLNELKELIREIPGGYITGLTKFESALEEIEDEYFESGVFTKNLFCGWIYKAEFKLETPLSSLLNHGEFKESIESLNSVTNNQKHGGWTQKTTSYRQMGFDVEKRPKVHL